MLKPKNISKIKFSHSLGHFTKEGFAIEAMPGCYVADANGEIMTFSLKRICQDVIGQFHEDKTELSFVEPEVLS
jgi:hypothetical protein